MSVNLGDDYLTLTRAIARSRERREDEKKKKPSKKQQKRAKAKQARLERARGRAQATAMAVSPAAPEESARPTRQPDSVRKLIDFGKKFGDVNVDQLIARLESGAPRVDPVTNEIQDSDAALDVLGRVAQRKEYLDRIEARNRAAGSGLFRLQQEAEESRSGLSGFTYQDLREMRDLGIKRSIVELDHVRDPTVERIIAAQERGIAGEGPVSAMGGTLDVLRTSDFGKFESEWGSEEDIRARRREVQAELMHFQVAHKDAVDSGRLDDFYGLGELLFPNIARMGRGMPYSQFWMWVEVGLWSGGAGVALRAPTAIARGVGAGVQAGRAAPTITRVSSTVSKVSRGPIQGFDFGAARTAGFATMRTPAPNLRWLGGKAKAGGANIARRTGGRGYDQLGRLSDRWWHAASGANKDNPVARFKQGVAYGLSPFSQGRRAAGHIDKAFTNEERFGFGIGVRIVRLSGKMTDDELVAINVAASNIGIDDWIRFHTKQLDGLAATGPQIRNGVREGVQFTVRERELKAHIASMNMRLQHLAEKARAPRPKGTPRLTAAEKAERQMLKTELRFAEQRLKAVKTPRRGAFGEKDLDDYVRQVEEWRRVEMEAHKSLIYQLERIKAGGLLDESKLALPVREAGESAAKFDLRVQRWLDDGGGLIQMATKSSRKNVVPQGTPFKDVTVFGRAAHARRRQETLDLFRLSSKMAEDNLIDARILNMEQAFLRRIHERELITGRTVTVAGREHYKQLQAAGKDDRLGVFAADWLHPIDDTHAGRLVAHMKHQSFVDATKALRDFSESRGALERLQAVGGALSDDAAKMSDDELMRAAEVMLDNLTPEELVQYEAANTAMRMWQKPGGAPSVQLSTQAAAFKEWTGAAHMKGIVDMAGQPIIAGDYLIRSSRLAAKARAVDKMAKPGIGHNVPRHHTDVPVYTVRPNRGERLELIAGELEFAVREPSKRVQLEQIGSLSDEITAKLDDVWGFSGELQEIGNTLKNTTIRTAPPGQPQPQTVVAQFIADMRADPRLAKYVDGSTVKWVSIQDAKKAIGMKHIPVQYGGHAGLPAGHPALRRNLLKRLAADPINNAVRSAILYLNPAYAPMNLSGNLLLNFVHQGFLAPLRLAQASRFNQKMGKAYIMQMDALMGEGLTSSVLIGKGFGKSPTVWAARPVQALTDAVPRRAALFHEIVKDIARTNNVKWYKVGTDDVVNWLKTASAPRQGRVAALAKKEIVDFDTLNQLERAFASDIIFFYPWLKGSTKLTKDLILDHPAKAAMLAYVGNETFEFNKELLGEWDEIYKEPFQDFLFAGARAAIPAGQDVARFLRMPEDLSFEVKVDIPHWVPVMGGEWNIRGNSNDLSIEFDLGYVKGGEWWPGKTDADGYALDKDGNRIRNVKDVRQMIPYLQTLELVMLADPTGTVGPSEAELKQLAGRLSPIFQRIIEASTRREVFFGRDIDTKIPGNDGAMLGWLEIAFLHHWLNTPGGSSVGAAIARHEGARNFFAELFSLVPGISKEGALDFIGEGKRQDQLREVRSPDQQVNRIGSGSTSTRGLHQYIVREKQRKAAPHAEKNELKLDGAKEMLNHLRRAGYEDWMDINMVADYLEFYKRQLEFELFAEETEKEVKEEYQIPALNEDKNAMLAYQKAKAQWLMDKYEEVDPDDYQGYADWIAGAIKDGDFSLDSPDDIEWLVESVARILWRDSLNDWDSWLRPYLNGMAPRDAKSKETAINELREAGLSVG